jgi:23S rRNA (uracil1939-C5)-methyltransferase
MEEGAYLAWKREQVAVALKSRGLLTAEIEPVRPVPLASRRRATLSLRRGQDGPVLGYRRSRSNELIDVAACPVLTPAISDRLTALKTGLGSLLGGKREARVTVTETLDGIDLLVNGVRPSPTAIGAFASHAGGLGSANCRRVMRYPPSTRMRRSRASVPGLQDTATSVGTADLELHGLC